MNLILNCLSRTGDGDKSIMDLLGIELHERRVFIAIADVNKSKRYIVEQKNASSQSAGARHYGCCAGEKCRRRTGSELFERKQHGSKIHKTGEIRFELVMAITNAGTADIVMNAVRAAGTRGGTVIHEKGTGAGDAKKFT